MNRIALALVLVISACVAEGDEPPTGELADEAGVPPTIVPLSNGQPVVVSGASGSTRYFSIVVPAGEDHFTASKWRPNGARFNGADLYVKRGALPTTSSYDCRFADGGTTSCRDDQPIAGTYYLAVRATTGYQDLAVEAWSWNEYTPIPNQWSESVTAPYGVDLDYKLDVPAGATDLAFSIALAADDVDGVVDLIVRRGIWPTATRYDCFDEAGYDGSLGSGLHTITCTFRAPQAGTYYVQLHPHSRYYATFTARYTWTPINTF